MKEEQFILEVDNSEQQLVMRIDKDGAVWWMKAGKLVRAKTDKQLGLAFGVAIAQITGLDPSEFIKSLKESK